MAATRLMQRCELKLPGANNRDKFCPTKGIARVMIRAFTLDLLLRALSNLRWSAGVGARRSPLDRSKPVGSTNCVKVPDRSRRRRDQNRHHRVTWTNAL